MHFKILSVIRLNLDQSKILSSGNELTLYHGDHGRESRIQKVSSSIPGGCASFGGCSLDQTFGESTGVVPRKQNQKRLVQILRNCLLKDKILALVSVFNR